MGFASGCVGRAASLFELCVVRERQRASQHLKMVQRATEDVQLERHVKEARELMSAPLLMVTASLFSLFQLNDQLTPFKSRASTAKLPGDHSN